MKSIEIKPFIINTIKEQLVDNYNFELIENISVSLKKRCIHIPTETFINIKLCNGMCFAPHFEESGSCYWTCSISLSDTQQEIKNALKGIISEIRSDLQNVKVFHYPLYYYTGDICKDTNIRELSFEVFGKEYSDLNKYQRSLLFDLCICHPLSSDELVIHLSDFVNTNGHFPFKYEKLYKTYEYALNIHLFTEKNLFDIEQLKNNCRKQHSQQCLQKLRDFCTEKKRWFYNTEQEMIDCIKYIYRYYRYDWFNEQECQEIDNLFKTYANNESKGELAVNSYLVKLGYTIKKQFTFDDCKDKRKLPFDTMFYIDKKLCLIEFDGEQHYHAIDYFGGEEHLKYIQRHDKIKNEYCKTHDIPLLRIKYDEIDNIDKLINQFINSIKTMVA